MSLFAVFPLLLFALAAIAAPVLTGIIVYRDAKSRAMDAILWSLVAALAPGFIGLIIYLVVRSSHKSLVCAHCGARLGRLSRLPAVRLGAERPLRRLRKGRR